MAAPEGEGPRGRPCDTGFSRWYAHGRTRLDGRDGPREERHLQLGKQHSRSSESHPSHPSIHSFLSFDCVASDHSFSLTQSHNQHNQHNQHNHTITQSHNHTITQLGLGDTKSHDTPVKIDDIQGTPCHISSGFYHSVAVTGSPPTFLSFSLFLPHSLRWFVSLLIVLRLWNRKENHSVYFWGTLIEERCFAYSPILVEELQGRSITHTSSGESHIHAISESGKVFSWGNGRDYRLLGFGTSEPCVVPQQIPCLSFSFFFLFSHFLLSKSDP